MSEIINAGRFVFEKEYDIPYTNMTVRKYTHPTGATLFYSDRDDGQLLFGIGFATAPWDSTGIFHILEHSVLDGSDSYPLREPFVNLMKTSMATDLNAYTAYDHTLYHFGTINEKDFRNMMSVYLDAVFHPVLLHDRRVFEKEAWRLEPDGNGGLIYNGVVYNEMQAHLGDSETLMWRTVKNSLLPDTCYANESGGLPSDIPDLTYEDYCGIYRRFYRPDNSVIYLVGKMDLKSQLEYIDGVISGIERKGEIPARPAIQTPVENLSVVCEYPAAANTADDGESLLTLAFGIDNGDSDIQHAIDIALNYMTATLESPLTKAVLDSGIGQNFEAYSSRCAQNQVIFSIKKAKSDDGMKFRRIVLDEIGNIIANGFDQVKISRMLEKQEVDNRLNSMNVNTPFGIMTDIVNDEIHGGKNIGKNGITKLRAELEGNPKYLEELLEKYVLNNKHTVLVTCNPSKTVAAERDNATKQRLAAIRAKMTDKEYAELCRKTEELHEYLATPDSEEALKCLPKLELSDLASNAEERFPVEKSLTVSGAEVPELFFEADTNGFVTIRVGFDLKHISFDRMVYLQDVVLMINDLGADGLTSKQLSDEFEAIQTNFRCICVGYPSKRDDCPFYVEYCLTIPDNRIERAIELLGKVMTSVDFDRDGVYRSLSSKLSGKRDNMMVSDGVSTALGVASASFSYAGAYSNRSNLVPSYYRLKEDVENFDKKGNERIAAMESIYRDFTCAENMIVRIAGSREDEAKVVAELEKLDLPVKSPVEDTFFPELLKKQNYAYAVENAVGYCVQYGNFANVGYEFKAAYNLITGWLSRTFFWDEVRAKGGAYGGGIFTNREGSISLYSYRDPHVANTYKTFADVADYVRENIPTGKELEELIISTAANYDKPESEFDKASAAFYRYMCKRPTTMKQDRESIINITGKDFEDFASALDKMNEIGVNVAISSKAKLEAAGMFDCIEEI